MTPPEGPWHFFGVIEPLPMNPSIRVLFWSPRDLFGRMVSGISGSRFCHVAFESGGAVFETGFTYPGHWTPLARVDTPDLVLTLPVTHLPETSFEAIGRSRRVSSWNLVWYLGRRLGLRLGRRPFNCVTCTWTFLVLCGWVATPIPETPDDLLELLRGRQVPSDPEGTRGVPSVQDQVRLLQVR